MSEALVKWSEATTALSKTIEVEQIPQVKTALKLADAAIESLKARKDFGTMREVDKERILLVWRAGKTVSNVQTKHGGDRSSVNDDTWSADQLGISGTDAWRWKTVALIPEGELVASLESWPSFERIPLSRFISMGRKLAPEGEQSAYPWFIYNMWNTKEGDDKDFFGAFPSIFMRNLLHFHTSEDDLVFDPFTGSGTTLDICEEMGRRHFCSDLHPVRDDIVEWNIRDGLPPKLGKPSFVFIDPPYWKQASNQYSEDPRDFGNLSEIKMFNQEMANLFSLLANIKTIAVVIQPTQYSNGMKWVDHIFDFAAMLPEHKIVMRYILPYSTQQYNAQQVEKAKASNLCLCLNRDLVIWERRE